MNIINKLTLRHLKENKGRTVVTTMGICVSVAMITAVFVALASFMNLFGEIELISSGNVHARFAVDSAQLGSLCNDDRIDMVGIEWEEENNSYQIENRRSNASGTGDFFAGDRTYVSQYVTGSYDGVLPQKTGEIAVEQSFIEKNSLPWKIGDTVSIPIGNRFVVENGEECGVGGAYQGGEKFRKQAVQDYKITAILHNNPATLSSILLCSLDESTAIPDGTSVSATVTLKDVNYKSLDVIDEIIKDYKIKQYSINNDYLQTRFAFGDDNELVYSILAMSATILAIIIIASVVLIYNAFAMSINERVRYLGMLASVGATKKQKRLSVYFESLVLAGVGIPVGIVAGIIGIGITLRVIGSQIISTGMILGVNESNMQMHIIVRPWVIAAIVLVSMLTVFVSAYIPSRKASAITPIDAIKQTGNIKIKAKKIRSSRLIRLAFGYEGELANKNIKRNGRKARVITASIAMSVILFLCCNFFCSMFTQSVNVEAEVPYQVTASVVDSEKEKLINQLENMSDVDDYFCINNLAVTIDKEDISRYRLLDSENLTFANKNVFSDGIMISCNILDDAAFNELCRKNGIDSKAYYGSDYKALLMNNINHKKSGSGVFTDSVIGAQLKGVFVSEEDKMTVGALVDYDESCYACGLNPKNSVSLYIPYSRYYSNKLDNYKAEGGDSDKPTDMYMVGIVTDKHAEVVDAINDSLETDMESHHYVNDIVENAQTMLTLGFIIKVLVYGFIALISLITVFNIVNTISTGVAMRKKEFAMLKSVGTTPKGFRKMIVLESALYGIKALVFALPISVLLSYAMHSAMGLSVIPFKINLPLYLSVIAVVFVIIGATMLYSVHKLRNDSIVETLKTEIN